ncbi:undecaprenyl-diphosphate phosphatase [Thioalkalivibrio paradoxus]|uniref:Undecaprenyl-diphosphatase n=1 Tax=Thioalkalivibrio paradoxus ARh 1 TaxID=713585 RepID=W0DPJ9_9GAMM|nr:undecaprenyl-diphosphate phosphatase [Thioalkalivibrio paradoxus]AHE98780.1 UDP-diphosphatase [Thioalkalivibrio paradoxus ARh 1]
MALWIAVLLGIIQGVFMFLPVSSTAHMVLAEHWLIGRGESLPSPDSPEMILFALVVHVGTLVSIIVVFWPSLWRFTLGAAGGAWQWAGQGGRGPVPLYWRLFWLGMFSVLCTGLLGLAFKAAFEQVFAHPWMIAITLTLTGILLWWTDRLPPRRRGLKGINWRVAGVIGLAQGLALMPGLSRSAMTIMFSLFAGLKRRWAAEYSFFLAIPTISAATLLQAIQVYRAEEPPVIGFAALAVGFVVAAVVGIVSLKLVIYFLYRAQLKVFSFYVWLLALAVAMGWIGV